MNTASITTLQRTMRTDQRDAPQSFDDLSDDELNEETLAAIAQTEELLASSDTKYYDSVRDMFDDILGTAWRG